MKKNQKGFVGLILIGVVVILIIFGGYFVFMKNSSPVTQQSLSATKDETANWQTYTNTQYGFEFTYPGDEKVTELTVSKDDLGKKIIYIEIINSKDSFTCIKGEDVRCKNIVLGNRTIIVQYGMAGDINARVDLLNGKSALLSLSCDSIGSGMTLQNVYCIISQQRQDMFDNLLSTFKLTK